MMAFSRCAQAARRSWRRLRRLGRVLRGRDVWCAPEIALPRERLGSDYGGWTFWPGPIHAGSVVYSFGVGEDVTFDLALIQRFGCAVHAFDPTPRSATWVRRQTLPEAFHFHEYGLGDRDGEMTFAPPANPAHVSYTLAGPGARGGRLESLPVRRLGTIVAELGHARIEVLKMDIEGSEYDALRDLLETPVEIGQVLVEFHHRLDRGVVTRTREAIARLRGSGFLLFDVSPTGEEYAFVNRATLRPEWSSIHEHCANAA